MCHPKSYLLFVLMLFGLIKSNAQVTSSRTLNIGIYGSLNTSVFMNDSKSQLGGSLGERFIFRPHQPFSLLVGFDYEVTRQYQSNVGLSYFSISKEINYQIHSFLIPLLVRYQYGKQVAVFTETGLHVGFVPIYKIYEIRESVDMSSGSMVTTSETYNSIDYFSKAVFGAQISVGTLIPISKGKLSIAGIFKTDFTKYGSQDHPLRNNRLALQIGLEFK